MEFPAHLIPAKEHDCNKSSFHKESQNSFDGKWCSKNVAHKPAVVTPVGSELKFKNQSRGHSHGKVDTEQFHPKLGGAFPKLIPRTIIHGLHDTHDDCQPQCERHKNPVINGCQCELRPRPVNQRSVDVFKHKKSSY